MSAHSGASVLVIGAGPAGLAAAASLKAMGVPFDLVDAQNHVGGAWNMANDDAPTWPSMRMISSKQHTQFEDLRMPVSFPAFPTTDDYSTHLRAYAAHHGLTEVFEPNMAVRMAQSFGEGQWEVSFSNGEVRPYAAVIAAHGVSNRPFLPPLFFEAKQTGAKVMHSKNFPGAEYVSEQKVLVVGSGQSAADIAVELADGRRHVALFAKEGHWVVPRTVGPFAADSLALAEPGFLSATFNDSVAQKVVTRLVGRPEEVGLPAPQKPLLEDEPIVSDTLLDLVRERKIHVLQEERHLPLDTFDLIVFATGYEPGADYLDPSYSEDLFLGAFPRNRRDLAILGQVRVTGGVTPILVEQADIATYAIKEFLDEFEGAGARSAALAEFTELKARRDTDVKKSPRITVSSGSGVRGRVKGLVSQVGTASHRARVEPSAPVSEADLADDVAITIPLTDRGDLLARLHTARKVFEKRR